MVVSPLLASKRLASPPRLESVMLGSALFWKRHWMRCEFRVEGVPPCAHRHTSSRHSCFVPCALLMKDSLIFLSTRWLYLNCCLGFLASCPIALEFMSCSPEWLYSGSRMTFWPTSQRVNWENAPAIIFKPYSCSNCFSWGDVRSFQHLHWLVDFFFAI